MTSTIVQSIHNTHLIAKWGSSQPSVVPGVRKFMNKATQGTSWDQQGSSQDQQDAEGLVSQQFPSDKNSPSHHQDDGQYHPDKQSSSAKKGISQTWDDDQYHEGSPWGEETPSTPSSNGHQYNRNQQATEGQPHMAKQLASTQLGTTFNADGVQYDPNQQSNWDHIAPSGEDLNSAVDTIQPSNPTQSHPVVTTNLATSTSVPSIPASPTSNTSASSTAAHAGIALSVTGTAGFIAVLILLPLYKKRRRLRQALSEKESVSIHNPLDSTSRFFNEFLSKIYIYGIRLISSMSDLVRPKRQTLRHVTYFGGTQPGNETGSATIDSSKSPQIEIRSTLEHSPPASIAFWVTESTSSSHSMKAPSKDQYRGQTECPYVGHIYDMDPLEKTSMENLLAAHPLVKDIYTVEMDYNSSRVGQLDLRVGQRLAILQTFDSGWVCVPEVLEVWNT
ncbi:hypothetical protein N7481_001321 [Penicillium waksmanii]|uniref:uncharacterized protein n=1 Tax=Penicillium waksmanii TaxID=69791 RepID=UPI002546EC4A|nr:uncharacterized protein N7481_001321 [Penicillium waksmanii]KAJ6000912.1 hypothetical protein N7481_001321 [Penicillium waksmanii]